MMILHSKVKFNAVTGLTWTIQAITAGYKSPALLRLRLVELRAVEHLADNCILPLVEINMNTDFN